MWYSYAYDKFAGIGGNILPPLPKTNTQIVPEFEIEQIKENAVRDSQTPPPVEKQSLQKKLETLHTNGWPAIPMASLQGINPGAAIEDQHPGDYQEYEPKKM